MEKNKEHIQLISFNNLCHTICLSINRFGYEKLDIDFPPELIQIILDFLGSFIIMKEYELLSNIGDNYIIETNKSSVNLRINNKEEIFKINKLNICILSTIKYTKKNVIDCFNNFK